MRVYGKTSPELSATLEGYSQSTYVLEWDGKFVCLALVTDKEHLADEKRRHKAMEGCWKPERAER